MDRPHRHARASLHAVKTFDPEILRSLLKNDLLATARSELGLLLRAPAYFLRLPNELRQELRNWAFCRLPRDRLPPSTELGNATTTKSHPWINVNVRPIG